MLYSFYSFNLGGELEDGEAETKKKLPQSSHEYLSSLFCWAAKYGALAYYYTIT